MSFGENHQVIEHHPNASSGILQHQQFLAEGIEAEAWAAGHRPSARPGTTEEEKVRRIDGDARLARASIKIDLSEPDGVALCVNCSPEPAQCFVEAVRAFKCA